MCQILHIILNPTDLFFEGQPSKTMPLSIKTRAILGSRYMLRHPQHLLQKTWCQHLFRIQSYLPSLTLNLRLRGDHVFPKNHLYTSGESTGIIRLPILGRSNNANRWSIWRIYLVIVHCLSWCPTMTPINSCFLRLIFAIPFRLSLVKKGWSFVIIFWCPISTSIRVAPPKVMLFSSWGLEKKQQNMVCLQTSGSNIYQIELRISTSLHFSLVQLSTKMMTFCFPWRVFCGVFSLLENSLGAGHFTHCFRESGGDLSKTHWNSDDVPWHTKAS